MGMQVSISELQGVEYVPYKKIKDARGDFSKFYESGTLNDYGIEIKSVAISENDEQGTVRGLHFQSAPFEESKIITCLSGRVFDVVVDLRPKSETHGKWACVELSQQEPMCLILPPKFAHGYQTLETKSSLLYLLSEIYSPDHAHTLKVSDQILQIAWPLSIFNLSEKDSQGSTFLEASQLV